MSEQDTYSIKEVIGDMRNEINERFDKVDAAQAHTNGDVTNLKMWRGYITGGLAVISAIVIPLLVYVWSISIRTNARVDTLAPIQYENR